ncbi:MAG: rhodanese-related sulfurtransferase [Pseudomonadales bacterium]
MPAVMTFYRFVRLDDLDELRGDLQAQTERCDLKGTILLANEGINATLAGSDAGLQRFRAGLCARSEFAPMRFRFSTADDHNPVFYRLKVRIKAEIVRLDQPHVAPGERTGEHVDARRWNELLDDPEVVVLDTRNGYEIGIGTFPGARDPGTRSFRQFPDYVRAQLDPGRHRKVAMFCTGGIRCEKASAWMLEQGFEAVYQLDGGILSYLETVPPDQSRWQGECFVFDQRVSVNVDLDEGSFEQCYACRQPLSRDDLASSDYVTGVSCPHCIHAHSEAQRQGFRERRRQEQLAAARGQRHVGASQPARAGSSESA